MTTTVLTDDTIERPAAASGAPSASDWFHRALNWDLTQPVSFAVLSVAYILSRAPFINIGYGTDPDAWRVALSGYYLWDHGEFYPSRLPGYPVPELASAAVIKGGWVATNGLTVAISLLGLWFFASIINRLALPNRALVVVGFAFTPLLWINSMTTMDYMWALTFIMGSYFFLLRRNSSLAGVMLGLAAASRSTSILMIIPFIIYLVRDGKRGELRDFITWSIAIPIFAYLPIAWRYGPKFLNFYDADVGYLNVLRLLGKDTLGLIGSIAVLIGAAISLPRLAKIPADFARDKDVMLWIVAIIIGALVFLRLPHESAYLLPIYPFGFFVMAKYFRTFVLTGVLSAIVLAGFVDLTSPGDEINSEAFTHARLGQGLVLSNRATMKAQLRFTHDLENLDVPDHSVVELGFSYPQFAVLNRDRLDVGILEDDKDSISQLSDKGQAIDVQHGINYVWLLEYPKFKEFLDKNYTILYTQDAGRSTAALYNFRPGFFNDGQRNNVRLIEEGRGPSGSSGAARTDR